MAKFARESLFSAPRSSFGSDELKLAVGLQLQKTILVWSSHNEKRTALSDVNMRELAFFSRTSQPVEDSGWGEHGYFTAKTGKILILYSSLAAKVWKNFKLADLPPKLLEIKRNSQEEGDNGPLKIPSTVINSPQLRAQCAENNRIDHLRNDVMQHYKTPFLTLPGLKYMWTFMWIGQEGH